MFLVFDDYCIAPTLLQPKQQISWLWDTVVLTSFRVKLVVNASLHGLVFVVYMHSHRMRVFFVFFFFFVYT